MAIRHPELALGVTLALGLPLAVVLSAAPASAGPSPTLYVSTSGANSGNCASTACATVAYAVGQAESNYDSGSVIIDVAAGPYEGSTEAVTINDSSLTFDIQATGDPTLSAAGSGSDFTIDSGSTATISGLSVTGGSNLDGGGFYNKGTLILTDDDIFDNTTSYTGGSGIYNYGTLTLTDSTVSGNTAAVGGGGILNGGTATVTDDNISDNVATGDNGGGIENYAQLSLVNDTIEGNTANGGGGAMINSGAVTLSDDTIVENKASNSGGGIYNEGSSAVVANSLLTNNTFNSGTQSDCGGGFTDGGYNVTDDASCHFAGARADVTDTAIWGPSGSPPALAANGSSGPDTLAIGATSAAFEYLPTSNCDAPFSPTTATDARGFPRPGYPAQSNCDAGAFELQAPPTCSPTVGNPACTISATATLTGGSLSLAAPSSLSWSGSLAGADQQIDAQATLEPVDATGSGAGWELTASSTQFSGSPGGIPAPPAGASTLSLNGSTGSYLSATGPGEGCAGGSTCTAATSTEDPVPYPVGIGAAAAVIYTADPQTGMGALDLSSNWWLYVPARALAGSYADTVTLTISSGP
jgi:hypothetical protein